MGKSTDWELEKFRVNKHFICGYFRILIESFMNSLERNLQIKETREDGSRISGDYSRILLAISTGRLIKHVLLSPRKIFQELYPCYKFEKIAS